MKTFLSKIPHSALRVWSSSFSLLLLFFFISQWPCASTPTNNPTAGTRAITTDTNNTLIGFGTNLFSANSNLLNASIRGSLSNWAVIPTNLPAQFSTNATNFALSIGANDTNFAATVSTNGTNFALTIGANGSNYTATIGANTTNYAAAQSAAAALAASNNVTLASALNFATNFTNSATLWVDKNGGTGQRGKIDKPFLTISNAVAAAQAGDTVIINPGTYAEHNLLKVGVNYINYGNIYYQQLTNDDGWGIFDDRPIGPTTNYICSFAPITFICPTNGISRNSALVISAQLTNTFGQLFTMTNRASHLVINGTSFHFGSILNAVPAAIYVTDGEMEFRALEVIDDFYGLSISITNSGIGGASVAKKGSATGIFWQLGTMHMDFEHLRASNYGLWGSEPAGNTVESSYWESCNLQEGKIYIDCNSTNYTSWCSIKKLLTTNTLGALAIGYDIYGSGKHYLVGNEKIEAPAGCVDLNGSPPVASNQVVYVESQKMTITAAGGNFVTAAGGTLRLTVPTQFDDQGGAAFGITTTNAGTVLYVNGGDLTVKNGRGIIHGSGTANIKNLTVDTSTTDGANNQPIYAYASGLKLQSTALIGPATPASIEATTTNTVVKVYGSTVANKAVGTNILQQVGTVTVDSNVN